ncbi:hypothetical protein BHE74_00026247 [Ensete ventricosum]|nr:hypothetical protein BHE74_00026247 [Ensete ventricosum]RZS04558.1 hypothetical protein BHM03_00034905 [Ensete ventricosum]
MRTVVRGFAYSLELRRHRLLDFARLLEVVLYACSLLTLSKHLKYLHSLQKVQQHVLPTSFLVEHSCINPKFLTFDYLDEKPVDTGLKKFLGLCPSALSWYLEFVSAFSTSLALLRLTLSLHESKGSMTPQKFRYCGTMTLPAHGPPIRCLASASLSSRSVGPPLRHCGTPPSPPPF